MRQIAHVGAWLVGRNQPMPADLHVAVPNLKAALLTLLECPTTTENGDAS